MRTKLGVLLVLALLSVARAETLDEDNDEGLPKLTMGIFLEGVAENGLTYQNADGTWTGFEVELAKQLLLVELAGYDVDIIRLPTYDSRITALQNHTVDFVLGLFAVTPERKELVDFVKPYYYSAGTSAFGPGDGCPEGISSWEDMNGTAWVMRPGFYSNDLLLELGVDPVWADSAEDAGMLVTNGTALGVFDDSFYSYKNSGNLTICQELDPWSRWRVAAGIAVPKNSTELCDLLSAAMMRMVEGGQDAIILKIENNTMVADGFPRDPDLQELVMDPSGDTFLNPADS